MNLRCLKCGKVEHAIQSTLAAAIYDWRLGFGSDPRWKKRVWVWEHGSCDNDGRWVWDGESPPPAGWEIERR
mgnify:CR=1 FL=1